MAWIGRARRLAIYMRDNFTCMYCGLNLLHSNNPHDVTLDHLVPRSRGGNNRTTNLITACRSCNSSRQAMSWRKFAGDEQIIALIVKHRRHKLNIKLARSLVRAERKKAAKPAGRKAKRAARATR
jgi:5-methylcytosine-specific restriction endonuclease McrA